MGSISYLLDGGAHGALHQIVRFVGREMPAEKNKSTIAEGIEHRVNLVCLE